MGSSGRVDVYTLKIFHAKFGAFVQQISKLVDFGVKRPAFVSYKRETNNYRTYGCRKGWIHFNGN